MSRLPNTAGGLTVLELLFTLALSASLVAVAVPLTTEVTDELRAGMAARYLEGRIMDARMHALRRSTRVALRFEQSGNDYQFAEYADANGNGVRTADITAGVDEQITPPQVLGHLFSGVVFGLPAGVPDVDGVATSSAGDGVRIGTSRILTLGPDGTATSGTLYLHGRRALYAVRILGATGRTRVLRFHSGARQWISR